MACAPLTSNYNQVRDVLCVCTGLSSVRVFSICVCIAGLDCLISWCPRSSGWSFSWTFVKTSLSLPQLPARLHSDSIVWLSPSPAPASTLAVASGHWLIRQCVRSIIRHMSKPSSPSLHPASTYCFIIAPNVYTHIILGSSAIIVKVSQQI